MTDEWTDKLQCRCAMEYYSAMKRSEVLIGATTCTHLENIMPSGISQTPRHRRTNIAGSHLFAISRIAKSIETEGRLAISRDLSEEGMGSYSSMGTEFLKMKRVVMFASQCECT